MRQEVLDSREHVHDDPMAIDQLDGQPSDYPSFDFVNAYWVAMATTSAALITRGPAPFDITSKSACKTGSESGMGTVVLRQNGIRSR
jgi:hypothetical protein